MNHDTPPEEIASALASEQFWLDAKEAWATAGVVDSEGFTELLLDLGERFEVALSLLPDRQRETVLSYLAEMGKSLSIRDLVRILAREKREPITFGQVTVSLLQEISGERFVDLLAGLAALDNQSTRRLVEVFRLFAPAVAVSDLLGLVKTRLSQGQDSGFAVEVWRTVEDFVLKLVEDPFMDQDYSKSLEDITDSSNIMPQVGEQSELLSDPDEYLDHVVLGLAMEGQDDWREKLLHRIESRVEQLEVVRILGFVRLVDGAFPKLMDSRPLLLRNLFKKGLATLATAKTKEREALIDFTLSHEGKLLDAALKALEEEKQISKRHFLVRLLASFSPASTPVFVLKARYGPWYLARNLAIVLSEQGASQGLPTLRALSKHPHPKVKKEAIRALRKVQSLQGNLSSQTSGEGVGSGSNKPDTIWSELPPNTNRVLP